jgi:hypothetical protein
MGHHYFSWEISLFLWPFSIANCWHNQRVQNQWKSQCLGPGSLSFHTLGSAWVHSRKPCLGTGWMDVKRSLLQPKTKLMVVNIWLRVVNNNLVGGAITILKNMSSSMGRMTSHIWNGKFKMFETTNQTTMVTKLPRILDIRMCQFSGGFKCHSKPSFTHDVRGY